jgi:hypothetical protein
MQKHKNLDSFLILVLVDLGKKIFFSYADSDSEYFQIPTIARALELVQEIDKVNYWKRDAKTDISKFMFEEVVKCDDFVVFCSENSLCSQAVKQEWEFALRLGKRIIPVFEDTTLIPDPLQMKRGIQVFSSSRKKKRKKTVSNISKLIDDMKKLILDPSQPPANFEEYQKILDKIKDNYLIQEFVTNFNSKLKHNKSIHN